LWWTQIWGMLKTERIVQHEKEKGHKEKCVPDEKKKIKKKKGEVAFRPPN